jgi:hypothetical protein
MYARVFLAGAVTTAAVVLAATGTAQARPSSPFTGDALERQKGHVVSRIPLNVRDNEPGTHARVVRSLPPGTVVEIACVGKGEKIFGVSDWYLLYTDYTHRAFVSAKYVRVAGGGTVLTCEEAYAQGLD